MYKDKRVGVVVPAYNEELLLGAVIEGIPPYVDRVYVIDDSSTDSTGELAEKMARESFGRIQVVRHERNGGVGKAIITGYRNCLRDNMDVAVVMAGDNQMDPAQLPKLLDPVLLGVADYAVGDRTSSLKNMKGMSYWRRSGNWLLKWLTRVAAWNFSICDPQNGYTAITRDSLLRLDLDRIYSRYGYCNDMLVRLSASRAKIKHVQMPAVYGTERSKIRYWKYIPSVSYLLIKDSLWRIGKQINAIGRRNGFPVSQGTSERKRK
jgi:glycosyltransferase involved in cell wall biosynthesis